MRPTIFRLVVLAGLACPARFLQAQLTIDREAVVLNPAQPSERVAEIVVRNAGAVDVQASVQLEDWEVDPRGASHWRKPGRVLGSCGNRVSVSPRVIRLAPGAQQTVRITVAASAKFDGECWSAAVVQPTDPSPRASVPLYVTPSGLTVDGEVSDMYVKGDSLEVQFTNTGKLRTDIVGQVQVRTPDDSVVMTIPLASATVLAGATRHLRIAMPKLVRGKYVLFAVIDFGGEQLTAAQAALEIQ